MRARIVLTALIAVLAAASNALAAFPGKNGTIAFRKVTAGFEDIWIISPSGGKERDVTRTRRIRETEPSFAPNGRAIAFVWSDGSGRHGGIGVVDSDGTRLRHLTSGVNPDDFYDFPHWTADGRSIAYLRSHNDANGEPVDATWSIPANGGPQGQITPDYTHAAVTSPIGSQLAYLEFNPLGNDFLKLTDENGANPVTVGGPPMVTDFSPDGQRFVYAHESKIFTKPVNGEGSPTLVANEGANDLDPVFSPDGRFVLWSNEATHDLWIARSNGRGARNFTHQAGFEKTPSWGRAP